MIVAGIGVMMLVAGVVILVIQAGQTWSRRARHPDEPGVKDAKPQISYPAVALIGIGALLVAVAIRTSP